MEEYNMDAIVSPDCAAESCQVGQPASGRNQRVPYTGTMTKTTAPPTLALPAGLYSGPELSLSLKAVSKDFYPSMGQSVYIARTLLISNLRKHFGVLHGRMLDFGCGSKPYKSLIRVDEYIGVDYEGQGHSHANEQIDVFYDGKTIPVASDHFDSVLSTEVFEHVFNPEEILDELHRVMKPGAVMLATCPFIIAEHEVPNDCSRYTSYGLKMLLERKGFEILYYEKLGTSIQAQMQMFMSYLDSYVLSKLNFARPIKKVVSFCTFLVLNLLCKLMNRMLPKRYDAFLNHIVICRKRDLPE
ncbi:Methyltransferase domain-containing protein [Chitinophaga rupis]|uniref:Methyltransferase domain-containing protein n=1 Tax=Chitinophaga rupis TaxID=573321 RepID=A0A1H7SQK4_9BACT|nr:class I SAM-dependent methyltransferase [Chitinophaga rupis]SEL74920.1 Methyltransferase domain-containing protein [Chitinophaga rupis]